MRYISRLSALFCLFVLAACASQPSAPRGAGGVSEEGNYKVGKPYQVDGSWYYPHEDYSYDETGIASWYGEAFHGEKTANGEVFNKDELTAAHKTLPLPTLARITNLDNGKSIVVRVNDRGPFSGARIVDVSQRTAQLLGFERQGTAKVRVQVLADESKAIADATRHYGSSTQVASAQPAPSVEVHNIEPVQTTPAVHQQLLATKPVEQVVQVPVTGSRQIYVQAGAFTVPENAAKLQQSLMGLGDTSVSDAIVNGKKFYRVRIGPIADVAHADEMIIRVKHTGIPNPRTVID